MRIIHVTATRLEKLRRVAKQLARERGTPLWQELERTARNHGFDSWQAVTVAARGSAQASLGAQVHSLPTWIQEFLCQHCTGGPLVPDTSFVAAFDVSYDVREPCRALLAPPLPMAMSLIEWLWTFKEDEHDVPVRDLSRDEALMEVDALLSNLTFFECSLPAEFKRPAKVSATDLAQACREACFFPPAHLWHDGELLGDLH